MVQPLFLPGLGRLVEMGRPQEELVGVRAALASLPLVNKYKCLFSKGWVIRFFCVHKGQGWEKSWGRAFQT